MKPFNELTPEEQIARRREMECLFPTRSLTPEEKQRAEEKKKRDEPTIGQKLIYLIKFEAQKAAREQIEPVLPLAERGQAQLKGLKKARAKAAEKRGIGSKADDPRIVRAQEAVDRINAAAQLWANGDRSQIVQVIKDMIAHRRVRQRDDGTVQITKDAMLHQVSFGGGVFEGKPFLPYGTLREWTVRGYLRGIPAAQKKTSES